MTGPEHYREAERLLAIRTDGSRRDWPGPYVSAAAQVHATLALAAAQALSIQLGSPMRDEWAEVAWQAPDA